MKRIILIVPLLILLLSASKAQIDRRVKNGFSVQLGYGIPLGAYSEQAASFYSLQLGSRWYIATPENYGLGIGVNWIDFSIGGNYDGESAYGMKAKTFSDFTVLEFGPVGTYALQNFSAIDAYFNFRPSYFSSGVVYENSNTESRINAAIGFSYALGFSYRYKALSFSTEAGFGTFKKAIVINLDGENLGNADLKVPTLRFLFGFKF